ncbi:MAG: DUF4198 domain-containing protein [Syntrophales bacterium]|nr:DUF4198 domain-containing protein [Syntrophales bacterium]MDD5641132.1 DUF4198 domain-containing protein [Syntrophales bacterium]
MKKCMVLALVLTLVSAATLYAHDAWIAKDGGVLVVTYGHGDKTEPYNPAKVKNVKAFNTAGIVIPIAVKVQEGKAILAPAKAPALVTLFFDSGPWVQTPEGYKNVSKREAKNVIKSLKSQKYCKGIWQWSDRFSKPVGSKMELVPLKNPLALKVGDKLPFLVVYEGKPLTGATVAAEGVKKDAVKTDPQGRAEIVITKKGLNIVGATRKTDTPKDPDADVLFESANLTFEVK